MIKEVTAWHDKHSKPVLVTEYGAGALAGLHTVFERQSLMGHYIPNSQNFWIRYLIQDPPVVDRRLSSGPNGAELQSIWSTARNGNLNQRNDIEFRWFCHATG